MRINLESTPVLVLNASYEAINVCSAQRAFRHLVRKDRARVEEVYGLTFIHGDDVIEVPAVIRFLEFRRIPHLGRSLSRKSIIARDRGICQYCHRKPAASKMTLDHIIPKCRAGAESWENLVACCQPCNNRKGDRTPEEAGMHLQRRPQPFTAHTGRHLLRQMAEDCELWQKYLFYSPA